MRSLFYTTRSKLISSFLVVALLVGLVSVYTGGQLLYKTVLRETESRISLDLNAARKIYQGQIDAISTALDVAALDSEIQDALLRKGRGNLRLKIIAVAKKTRLDFAGVTSADGTIMSRVGAVGLTAVSATSALDNPLVRYVLNHGSSIGGTIVLDSSLLASGDPAVQKQTHAMPTSASVAEKREKKAEATGMAIGAASPIFRGGKLIGILYGGQMLNGSNAFVDAVRDAVFQNDVHEGRSVGVATIFLGDTRISSNLLNPDGKRALGTRAPEQVRASVLGRGQRWTDRAFVANDWYLTAYEPINDIFGDRVGMLATAVLEAKYRDVQKKALIPFLLITVAGMLVAISMGIFLSNRIMRPIRSLISASTEVSNGNFSPEIGRQSRDEIGVLQKTFTNMLSSLREREKRQSMESEIKLLQSEKQASVGRLAAGVAHEINNPLTGVLTFTHMLLKRKDIDEAMRGDLAIIAKATDRVRTIVKGLLEFSRETLLAPEPTHINELVSSTVKLVGNNALIKGVKLTFTPMETLPLLRVDKSAIQGVLLNIIMNALDATARGGSIRVSTNLRGLSQTTERESIEIIVTDTGQGIPPAHLNKIFEPFFTTKDVGEGTGLGLSVSLGMVERHGGSIRVESVVGKGSAFTISLPLGGHDEQ